MAMKKAELEEHRSKYEKLMVRARKEEKRGFYRKAVELALSSWDYIDGMMQYERRFEKREFESIPAIDLTLKYAPFLFDFESMGRLEDMLKDCRRLEKNTSECLADKLCAAREVTWEAHRLWGYLEKNPDVRQDDLCEAIGGKPEQWDSILEIWERMGLIQRANSGTSFKVSLITRMGKIVRAKCSSCGEIVDGPKAIFLEELRCPECSNKNLFVILAEDKNTSGKRGT